MEPLAQGDVACTVRFLPFPCRFMCFFSRGRVLVFDPDITIPCQLFDKSPMKSTEIVFYIIPAFQLS